MSYNQEELEKDDNPMSIVVLASQERERHRRRDDRFNAKWYLIRKLYEKGYSREEIVALFEFIDWVLRLSEEEEIRLWDEMKNLEEVNKMRYVTSVERIGRQRGLQEGLQGMQQMILDALEERFGEVTAPVSDAIHQIYDQDRLRALLRQALRTSSIEECGRILDGMNN